MLNCVKSELQRSYFHPSVTESTVCSCEFETDAHCLLETVLIFFLEKHKRDIIWLLCTSESLTLTRDLLFAYLCSNAQSRMHELYSLWTKNIMNEKLKNQLWSNRFRNLRHKNPNYGILNSSVSVNEAEGNINSAMSPSWWRSLTPDMTPDVKPADSLNGWRLTCFPEPLSVFVHADSE